MITAIGNSGGALAAVRLSGLSKPKVSSGPAMGGGAEDAVEIRLGSRARSQEDIPRAGFGDGTVSSPGAALRTIGRGVEAARKIVPTLEQIQEARLARNAEVSSQSPMRERASQPQELKLADASANAVAGARDLMNSLGSSLATTQARLAGEAPEATRQQASVSISGETVALYARRTDKAVSSSAMATATFDVRA